MEIKLDHYKIKYEAPTENEGEIGVVSNSDAVFLTQWPIMVIHCSFQNYRSTELRPTIYII